MSNKMAWKRTRAGAFKRPSRMMKVSKGRRPRQGAFKRKVARIARSVVKSQKEWKMFDQVIIPGNISTASVPIGSSVLSALNMTALPAQGTTGSTRIGNSVKASSIEIKGQFNNVTPSTQAIPANKSLYLRLAILELLDQADIGNITSLPGNAMFELNSANLDMQTTSNRMTAYFNRRIYKVHLDKVFQLGSITRGEKPTGLYFRHKMMLNGQTLTADVVGQDLSKERLMFCVAFIDSQDGDRSNAAANENVVRVRWETRLGFTDA